MSNGVPSGFSTGLIPRDFKSHPVGCFAYAPAFPDDALIPESEWPARLAQQKADRASLLDLRTTYYDTLKSLNQNGYGLCWAFSSTKATMYIRATQHGVFERLSAYWVAGKVMNWRDQGYYGAASLGQIVKAGVPLESLCPTYSSRNDTPECQADAATRKVTEWWDGSDDRDLARRQMVSSLLVGIPCVVDLNWLSHSMAAIHIESLNPLTIYFDNSWGEGNNKGLYIAKGSQAIPDGLVIPRVATAA